MFSLRSLAASSFLGVALLTCTLDGQTVDIAPERASGIYQPGETVRWKITVTDPAKFTSPTYSIKSGGLNSIDSGPLTLSSGTATLTATLSEPGWLLLEVDGKNATNTTIQTYGGALVAPDKLRPGAPRPADFDTFWKAKLDELAAVPMNAVVTPGVSDRAGVTYSTIKMDGIKSSHIQGQIARPTTGTKFPAMLILQWAGVYSLQKSWATWPASQGWLVLNIQAHDINPIDSDSYYATLNSGALSNYAHIGNEDRDTSYFLRMYLSCSRAADYLASRPDWDGRVLVATGASQGGLQSFVVAALNPKITSVIAEVPAGCDQAAMDVGRLPGWPVWVWQAWDRDLAKVKTTAGYYDVTNFAPLIHCPVLAGPGLGDGVATPSGIYTACNLLDGAKQVVLMPKADHGAHHEPFYGPKDAWLAAAIAGKPPVITVAPQPASARAGQSVSFSVVATDSLAVGYEWEKDGVPITGATQEHLTLSSVGAGDAAAYRVKVTGPGGTVTSNPVTLTLDAGDPPAAKSNFINLSTRAYVSTGDNILIAGFVVRGPGSKRVLIRGIGPTLKAFGIDNALADPVLTLKAGPTLVVKSNDNWNDSADVDLIRDASIPLGAFALPEAGKDSVILVSLPEGDYTALLQGASSGQGVGLIEVYDADAGSASRLINISSRGFVNNANPMIAGFAVSGVSAKSILSRGVSPSLSVFNVSPLLAHPGLTLVDQGHSVLAYNKGWETSADALALPGLSNTVGASPTLQAGVADSALTTALPTGLYTVILDAPVGETGVALAELYEAP